MMFQDNYEKAIICTIMRRFEDNEDPALHARQGFVSETNIRILTAMITLAAAILNFMGRSDKAILAVGIASGLVFLWLTISWLRVSIRRFFRWYSDRRYVAREFGNLKQLFEGLGKFTRKDDVRSFRQRMYSASAYRHDVIDKILGNDYIEDWLMTFEIQMEFPCRSFVEFLARCREFTTIVNRYNTDYVIKVQKSIEQSPAEVLPNHCLDQFEEFRERFSAYLNDIEKWAESIAKAAERRVSVANFLQHVPHRSFNRVKSFKKTEVPELVQTKRAAG